jgi:hypothetical protein
MIKRWLQGSTRLLQSMMNVCENQGYLLQSLLPQHNTACEADPKQCHAEAVQYLGRYLQGTKDRGLYLDPDESKSFECWVEADFLGLYVKGAPGMHLDKMTSKSRTRFIITYAGCPIMWGSKLQRESALSSCESEYIGILESYRDHYCH